MRDISELPGGTEQAQSSSPTSPTNPTSPNPTTPKPRAARSKPENTTTTGSQDTDTKPPTAPRRRTTPANPANTNAAPATNNAPATNSTPAPNSVPATNSTPAPSSAPATNSAPAPSNASATNSAPAPSNASATNSAPAPKSAPAAAGQNENAQSTPSTGTPHPAPTQAPRPAPRPAPAPHNGPNGPVTHNNPPTATYRNGGPNQQGGQPFAPRPNGPGPNQQGGQPFAPRPNGPGPNQRNNNGPMQQRPGPIGPGGPGGPNRFNNNNNGPRPFGPGPGGPNNAGPRPAPMNRMGGPGIQPRPVGGGNAPAPQRTFSTPDRPPGGQGSHGNQRSSGQRSGGGGRSGGGNAGPGQARSGGPQGRPGGKPGGARPAGTAAPRTQERRTPQVKEKPTGPISLPPQIVVKDLAELMGTSPIEVIRDLINKHAIFASINQVVEYEKAALVAKDMGFEPSLSALTTAPAVRDEQSASEVMNANRDEENYETIPPVVTIMGHVDHGKTSLLDTIRKTKVASGEAGGITQHIGAYQVEVNGKKITFLDTPGHEAFTAMRARGAQVAHIAVIVIAADDGMMPQTREAIDHARAAKMPLVIAINKVDKANANPDRVKQQLAEIGIVIEEYGGDTVCVPISARRGEGIDELLEYILLVAEVQDIRANPNRLATGVIIEARLEKNSGATATVLIQQGTLKRGDNIVVGGIAGKIRAMFNDHGKPIQKATPSTPVSILGLPEVPQAGDHLEVTIDERTAKQMAEQEFYKRRDETMPLGQVNLDTLYMQMQEGKVKELNVILKCDVQGSSEAIKGSLSKLGEENMKVRLIHEGIGNISETDVYLASASKAIIIGFNVKADGAALREAQKEGVDIRYYDIIYKLIDDIQAALVGMLEPTYREVVDGHAEVLQIFKAGKTTVIAGCRITDGKLTRSSQARIMRKDEKAYEGKIESLRRGKDDVREVLTGYECGIVLEDFIEFEVGDIIEAFSQERVLPGSRA